jgi:tetratricopeptide (TPR) repeat protein
MLILVIAIAASSLGSVASADDKETARREFLEGTRRYDLNEFGPALEAFKRAYMAYEDPAFLFNIAQCYRQLGDKPNAASFYRSYLRKVPDAPNREDVSATIATLDAAIAQDNAKAREKAAGAPAPSPPTPRAVGTTQNQLVTAAPPPKRTPVYKKWWLWTVVGVVAAGAATAIAVTVTSQRTENSLMPITVTP